LRGSGEAVTSGQWAVIASVGDTTTPAQVPFTHPPTSGLAPGVRVNAWRLVQPAVTREGREVQLASEPSRTSTSSSSYSVPFGVWRTKSRDNTYSSRSTAAGGVCDCGGARAARQYTPTRFMEYVAARYVVVRSFGAGEGGRCMKLVPGPGQQRLPWLNVNKRLRFKIDCVLTTEHD